MHIIFYVYCYAPMFLVYLVIGALQMFFDDDDFTLMYV